jgi:hypothetical protein
MTYMTIDLKKVAKAQMTIVGAGTAIPVSLYFAKKISEPQLRNYTKFFVPYCIVSSGILGCAYMFAKNCQIIN